MVQWIEDILFAFWYIEKTIGSGYSRNYVQWFNSKGFLGQEASIVWSELYILFYFIVLQFSSVDVLCISTAFRSFYLELVGGYKDEFVVPPQRSSGDEIKAHM